MQRVYQDIQEPMMNAATEGLGGSNPYTSSTGGNSGNCLFYPDNLLY